MNLPKLSNRYNTTMRLSLSFIRQTAVVLVLATNTFALEGPTLQRLAAPKSVSNPVTQTANHRAPLTPSAFSNLPFGSIRPRGFLAEQMRLDSSGLAGHLGEIFNDVDDQSGWRGGGGESWERGPYYARGLVALACATGDPLIKAIEDLAEVVVQHYKNIHAAIEGRTHWHSDGNGYCICIRYSISCRKQNPAFSKNIFSSTCHH